MDRLHLSRRAFFVRSSTHLGVLGLASLLNPQLFAAESARGSNSKGLTGLPHFQPRAKRVIYLFQSGGPAQMDLYDYKPHLADLAGEEVPKSIYPDERKTTMSSAQASFAVAPSKFKFAQQGQAGTWMSELLPHIGSVADELCVIRSLHTDAINHDPAITLLQTGSQIDGSPSTGSRVNYGLGSERSDLPTFVALRSRGEAKADPPL